MGCPWSEQCKDLSPLLLLSSLKLHFAQAPAWELHGPTGWNEKSGFSSCCWTLAWFWKVSINEICLAGLLWSMNCARVLYRLVAYLQFIGGHLLLPQFSEILFPWNCCFLELASSVAGMKLFLCLLHCSEVVSLKQCFCPGSCHPSVQIVGPGTRGDFT